MDMEKEEKLEKADKPAKTVTYKATAKCYAAGRVYNEGEIVKDINLKDNPCFIQVKD